MSLCFSNISHRYGNTPVLKELNFTVEAGQISCLLGPSGGGKSTLLRLAAGLEFIQSGEIRIDDETLASVSHHPPPEARPVGLMFQENALFPNMTVAENIAFGLQDLDASARQNKVSDLLNMVGLPDYADRLPYSLSGGQQQRVALIRSLAPEPRILLMDEPYASIDITLRRSLREAARNTIKQSNTTAILVTHDPEEAMEMADTIAVLCDGRILQTGTPQEIYEMPVAEPVAALFGGAQSLDILETVSDGFVTEYGKINTPHIERHAFNEKSHLIFRPNGINMHHAPDSPLAVMDIRYVGDAWLAFLRPENAAPACQPLRVAVAQPDQFSITDKVGLEANADGFFVFDDH